MKTKTLFLTLFLLASVFSVKAQDYSKLDQIPLKDKSDYPKNENLALECAKYILDSPIDVMSKDLNHTNATLFLIKWMSGTPDYTFTVDETAGKILKTNSDLLVIYFAASVKYVLENKDMASNDKEVKLNTITILLTYCEDPSKNVKLNGELKKMIKAKNENTLREYLKL